MLDAVARSWRSVYWRNIFLLGVSFLFYIWGEAANVFILVGLGIFNYYAGLKLAQEKQSRIVLTAFIAVNLSVLIYYKYAVWLVSLVMPGVSLNHHAMPLGISFFTFHALSYLIDIYRRQIKPAQDLGNFLTYFCMFPHLVAGPIVRYAQISGDLVQRGPDWELFNFGVYRFLVGLNKKVIIANSVSVLADTAFKFSSSSHLGASDAWVGILAYSVQIYFDFSGYSDMAIGLAAMLGFRFEENFKRPYSSASIKEFWRRWHISLSSWFRDYLYIPLGGSRNGEGATYRNLLIVFFFCGLWHGANWTFVIWGLWHGSFLVLERLKPITALIERLPVIITRIYTMLIVLVGWVFFRAENLPTAFTYFKQMFSFAGRPMMIDFFRMDFTILLVGILICMIPDRFVPQPTSHKANAFSFASYLLQFLLAFLSIAMLLTSTRNPFIYFNF